MKSNNFFRVIDNSGVKLVRLIHRYGKKQFIYLGEKLLLSCRIVVPKKKWVKGQKVRGILIHSKQPILRGPYSIRCDENTVIILKENLDVKATRVKGIIFREFRKTAYKKLLSLGDYVL